ncbi:hypothetical protein [Chitinophaga pinensis]|uniref:Uncharacterized protein n=1 Tax=Chitinophaga pinensis (strain ATCC 43595 / DSM 2588 / LMG 13176 / NBRC 15968 / NCIMB 11800 / UQM 2034) TaxID=485918 RepID=A0A979FYR3_CHIPD|nr:hypothetical protein [Chitinophaga pinensis]ACU57578.1 hypothetical protein Cpin_0072 [Chitinophaga pinensis DSM 2588]
MRLKKVRCSFLVLAVILGAGSALATTVKTNTLREVTQYYWNGSGYAVAGVEGYDYVCEWSQFGTCTYVFDSATGTYKRSKYGKISFLR